MKKIISLSTVILLMTQIGHAETASKPAAPAPATPATAATAAAPVKTAAPAASTPVTTSTAAAAPIAPATQPKAPLPINCLYKLTNANQISETELALWAQYAAVKSFDYSFDKIDSQLQNLKTCFTEKGWLGFNEALNQSGNLTTIKSQQLTVSSQIAGKAGISTIKPNQWKITIPLDVVYQNTQEKLTQSLEVVLMVTKKSPTELGVVQLIATPKPASPATTGAKS